MEPTAVRVAVLAKAVVKLLEALAILT